jgi:hypothetical protein
MGQLQAPQVVHHMIMQLGDVQVTEVDLSLIDSSCID